MHNKVGESDGNVETTTLFYSDSNQSSTYQPAGRVKPRNHEQSLPIVKPITYVEMTNITNNSTCHACLYKFFLFSLKTNFERFPHLSHQIEYVSR